VEQRTKSRYFLAVTSMINRNPYASRLFETSSALLRLHVAMSRPERRRKCEAITPFGAWDSKAVDYLLDRLRKTRS
jgi:hypothetical protein